MDRARQWAGRTCLAGAAVCALLAVAMPRSGAQEAGSDEVPLPDVFRGAATSLVASVQVDREALLPIPEVFRFIALDGSGTYEQSRQEARASLLFPGNGLILGPDLACGTFGGQFPEDFKPILDTCTQYDYPLTVYADGFEPDGTTEGALQLGTPADPISGHAAGATAHAGEDGVVTDAAMQDLRVMGFPAVGPVKPPIPGFELDTSVLTIDSATSRTNQRIEQGGLVVDASATLSGVRMIGGLLEIGSIRSTSHVLDDGKGAQTPVSALEISGVTVAGQPAQITEDGLVVGADGGGQGPLAQAEQSAVNELLKNLDVKVTLLPASEGIEDGAARASVGGVLVEFARDAQGLPILPGPIGDIDPNGVYTGSILLGATAALGSVPVIPDDAAVGDIEPAPAGGLPLDPGSASLEDTGGEIAADLGSTAGGDVTESSSGATGGGDEPGATEQQTVGFVDELFSERLPLLYLAFTLAALGLCLAPRLTLPARLPGNR